MRNCRHCGKELVVGEWKSIMYCSNVCRKEYLIKKYQPSKDYELEHPLSSSTKGAINEYVVAIDLLRRGYAVFRACSPACKCDLVAWKNDRFLRVEVKTGSFREHSNWANYFGHGKAKKINYDLLAIVVDHSRISYRPEFE